MTWQDACPAAPGLSGFAVPTVLIGAGNASYTFAGGAETVTFQRGATTLPVTFAVTDINPIDIALAINTIFPALPAFCVVDPAGPFAPQLVLQDAVRARVVSYTNPINGPPKLGFPILDRNVAAAASSVRLTDIGFDVRNTSAITSNFLTLPAGTKEVVYAVTVSNIIIGSNASSNSDVFPAIAAIFSNASAGQEPPYSAITQQLGLATIDPNYGTGGRIENYAQTIDILHGGGVQNPNFIPASINLPNAIPSSQRLIRMPAPVGVTRVRFFVPLSFGPSPTVFANTPSVAISAWAVG